MALITSWHNKTLLDNRAEPNCTIPLYNCRNKSKLPTGRKVTPKSIVYKAATTSGGAAKHYYGGSETEFKVRFYNHNQSFKYDHKSNSTKLSKTVWQAKDAGKDPSIKWSIMAHHAPYQPGAKTCNLCLTEKLHILQADSSTMLN